MDRYALIHTKMPTSAWDDFHTYRFDISKKYATFALPTLIISTP